jgi:hypothetical protein
VAAQIELGKLLEQVTAGRQPESGATVAQLLDQYVQVAEWDLPTRNGFEGYIRRTIKPALGHMQVRKVRGPVLDMFYARLKKCGDLACTGRPFTEHRNVPVLTVKSAGLRPAWQQVADALREAIQTGVLPPGGAAAVHGRAGRAPGFAYEHAQACVLRARGRRPDRGPAGAYCRRRR